MQIADTKASHQASHFNVSGGSSVKIGDDYHEAAKPLELVPRSRKCGLCLGNSPKIENAQFHGHQADLDEMRAYLEADDQSSTRRCLVLGGLGGVGKTQLALRYAECFQASYDSVFWLNASTEATLGLSFRDIAEDIFQNQDIDKFDDNQVQVAIRQWLSDQTNGRWLLIYDNYDDPDAYNINKYYPRSGIGSIISTTRLPEQINGHRIRVGPLTDIKESLAILQTRSGRDNVDIDEHARTLAQRLAGLPLALATVGSYLKTSTWTFKRYLEEYEKKWNVNPYMPTKLPEYHQTLHTAWDLSYARLQTQYPNAAQLLNLLAYFDNQKLWFEHFEGGASENLPESLHRLSSDQAEFENLMNILVSHCFVEVQVDTQSYSIHALVHDWTLAVLNHEVDPASYQYAFSCTRSSIIENNFLSLAHLSYLTIAAHARRLTLDRFTKVAALKEQLELYPIDTLWVAELLRHQSALKSAEFMYLRVLAGNEKALGPNHSSTLLIANNLAIIHNEQGNLDEAESIYLRVLAGNEKALGSDHLSNLNTVNNLGVLYVNQCKLEEAETIFLRAIAGYEKTLGLNHTAILETINNLGILYKKQGKLDKAEKMYLQAQAGLEEALGRYDGRTLSVVDNLGNLYQKQGNLDKAETTFQRALAAKEKTLGPDHTSTLNTVNNLGNLYADQSKPNEAETLYLRALAGFEKALGPHHSSTLVTIHNLGDLYYAQGRLEEAETMFRRTPAGRERKHQGKSLIDRSYQAEP